MLFPVLWFRFSSLFSLCLLLVVPSSFLFILWSWISSYFSCICYLCCFSLCLFLVLSFFLVSGVPVSLWSFHLLCLSCFTLCSFSYIFDCLPCPDWSHLCFVNLPFLVGPCVFSSLFARSSCSMCAFVPAFRPHVFPVFCILNWMLLWICLCPFEFCFWTDTWVWPLPVFTNNKCTELTLLCLQYLHIVSTPWHLCDGIGGSDSTKSTTHIIG